MGQRSQIYVKFLGPDGEIKLIARYFGWNYGERMVSRARWTMEWCKEHKKALSIDSSCIERLISVINTNFDMHDVAVSTDLVNERNTQFPEENLNEYVFGPQNCSDGKLFIDLTGDDIKYAFTDENAEAPMNAPAYMAWDLRSPDWQKTEDDVDEWLEDYKANEDWIHKNAVLMTEFDLFRFTVLPYSSEPVIKKKQLSSHHIEELNSLAVNGDYTEKARTEMVRLLAQLQKLFWKTA